MDHHAWIALVACCWCTALVAQSDRSAIYAGKDNPLVKLGAKRVLKGIEYPKWFEYPAISPELRQQLIDKHSTREWLFALDDSANRAPATKYTNAAQLIFDLLSAYGGAGSGLTPSPTRREIDRALKDRVVPTLTRPREGYQIDAPSANETDYTGQNGDAIRLLDREIAYLAKRNNLPVGYSPPTTANRANVHATDQSLLGPQARTQQTSKNRSVADAPGASDPDLPGSDEMDRLGYMMNGEEYFKNRPGAWERFKARHPDYREITAAGYENSERAEAKHKAMREYQIRCAQADKDHKLKLKSQAENHSKALANCRSIADLKLRSVCVSAETSTNSANVAAIDARWKSDLFDNFCGRKDALSDFLDKQ